MKIIRPVTINDAALVSSTVAETDYTAWSSGTTYAIGDRCIRTSTHRIYESLVAGNLNNTPETNTSGASPKWLDIGPTNRWAMFDEKVGTQTTATTTFTVVIAPGRVNGLALMQIEAGTVDIEMTDGGSPVYTATASLNGGTDVLDWFGYFFDPIVRKTDIVFTDLPLYESGEITITLSDSTGTTVKCGVCAVGMIANLGNTRPSPKIGITDYSRKDVDEFGHTGVLERSYSKRSTVALWLDSLLVDSVARILADVRATPVVWIGADNLYTSLLIYGFYRDFEVDIATRDISFCSLQIEGLT